MRGCRGARAVFCLLLTLVAGRAAATEPERPALSYEQAEDRAGFIALVRKARQGDTESQWQVGQTYARLGEPARALPMLQAAAVADHPRAAALLGTLHEAGRGTAKSREEAMRWYRLAADRGEPQAMAALGRLLLLDHGPEVRESAWQWLRQAARRDDRDGQYHLGWLLAQPGPAHDDTQAYQLFVKAAGQGHVGAQVAAAIHLLAGRGVATDKKAATQWLQRAAKAQDPVAHYLLARTREGAGQGDRDAVRNSYRIAATAGHREAQFALGAILAKSRVEAERKEAVDWFAKAHAAGHRAATNRLGEIYREGIVVLQQPDKARDYFKQAADEGDANAMYNLAQMLNEGLGGPRDTDQALKWYTRSAEQGHQEAMAVVDGLLNSSVKTSSLSLKGFWH